MPASPFTCVGFPPSIDANCTHIILGSMPGAASLRAQQYYAYPQNRFWRLMAYLLEGGEPPQDYAARLQMLLRHHIALWDSIASCEREGSLDSAIRAAKPNDFTVLLAHYPLHLLSERRQIGRYFPPCQQATSKTRRSHLSCTALDERSQRALALRRSRKSMEKGAPPRRVRGAPFLLDEQAAHSVHKTNVVRTAYASI